MGDDLEDGRQEEPLEEEKISATRPMGKARATFKALRPHQWVKNLLIFVPVALDHRITDLSVMAAATIGFLAFGLAASGGYVLNDLLDLEADRAHPRKRHRPFASGALSVRTGMILIPLLFASALIISYLTLPGIFLVLLALYVALTATYSHSLKEVPALDVVLLAGLYSLRILAGTAATGVPFSTWLVGFSAFFFLSLAFMKRYSEVQRYRHTPHMAIPRRGYSGGDLDWLRSSGGAAGYMSVLVLALYISHDDVTALYTKPNWLWLICALLLYWITRMWFRTHRGMLHEDPIVATARDRASYIVGALVVVILTIAA